MNYAQLSGEASTGPLALPAMGTLQAFERAAAHQSFRLAAEELGLSPSAISHQIRGLEERFQVRLFARAGRVVRLTPEGERYLTAVRLALRELDVAGRELEASSAQGRLELRVSALPFFTSTVLLPALGRLGDYQKGMSIRLQTTHDYADFDSAGVDVAIRFGRERTKGLRFEPLLEVRSVPVCTPAVAARLSTLDGLAHVPRLHVSAQPRSWSRWLAASGRPDLESQSSLWFDTVPSALEAAEHGHGVALAMHPLIKGRPGFGTRLVAPFDVAGDPSTFYLVMRPEQARDRLIGAFRRWLTDAVAQVTSSPPQAKGGSQTP